MNLNLLLSEGEAAATKTVLGKDRSDRKELDGFVTFFFS